MYGVAFALTTSKLDSNTTTKQIDDWIHANKVCRHALLNVLSNILFDVYASYKEAKDIWDYLILKYTAKDIVKKRFVFELLIEKLPQSWTDYKQPLTHRHKQMSLLDLITHIITEDTNKKECATAKVKNLSVKANVVEDKPAPKRYEKKI